MSEEVAGVFGLDFLGSDGAGAPQAFETAHSELSQNVFELCESLFDGIEIRAVGRQKAKLGV